jgi:hypothetical protein
VCHFDVLHRKIVAYFSSQSLLPWEESVASCEGWPGGFVVIDGSIDGSSKASSGLRDCDSVRCDMMDRAE